jgi:hypothetical protein
VLELEAALTLDPLHDARHAGGPQRRSRLLVAAIERDRQRTEHEHETGDDGERHRSIVGLL